MLQVFVKKKKNHIGQYTVNDYIFSFCKEQQKKHSGCSRHASSWRFIPFLFPNLFVQENQFEPAVFMFLKWE